jgi:RNA binding exosome subunit
LCVPTNVNYINVATFVTETEDSSSLIEALQVIGTHKKYRGSEYLVVL